MKRLLIIATVSLSLTYSWAQESSSSGISESPNEALKTIEEMEGSYSGDFPLGFSFATRVEQMSIREKVGYAFLNGVTLAGSCGLSAGGIILAAIADSILLLSVIPGLLAEDYSNEYIHYGYGNNDPTETTGGKHSWRNNRYCCRFCPDANRSI